MKGIKLRERMLSVHGRRMLAMQGYADVPEGRLAVIRPWLRVAPGVTAFWMLMGTLTQSPLILWVLVPFTLLGALLPVHPFDVFYNHIVRHVLGGPHIPSSPVQRRLCCAIAGGWAAVTALLFEGGYPAVGMWTGGFAAFGCLLPAVTEFCIPSFVLQLLGVQGEPRESGFSTLSTGTLPWWALAETEQHDRSGRTLYVSGQRAEIEDAA